MKITYQYFDVKILETANRIEFTNLFDFCKFAEQNSIKQVLKASDDLSLHSYFLLLFNNAIFQQESNGFKFLEDFLSANSLNFPDAVSYYEAKEAGYDKYEDYFMMKECGINDHTLFDAMKSKGFLSGHKQYLQLLASLPDIKPLPLEMSDSPYKLYMHAIEKGFINFKQFADAFAKGFVEATTYLMATELGFPSQKEFEEANHAGFRLYQDWKSAKACKAKNAADYKRFSDLQSLFVQVGTHDKCVLLILLSKIEQGKKISINKLTDLFKKQQEEYRYEETGEMPEWYTTSLLNQDAIIHFLYKDLYAKRYGHYDNDGEFFQINLMQDREIVLDGSNVAHNSVAKTIQGNNAPKPLIANIIKVTKFLLQKGFPKVSVIVDASLKHKIADIEKLNELKKLAEYLEAPRETPADIFIINHVKRSHCLLVSNDNFREWKLQDPWVAENLDYYRFAFMIKGDDVLMPDLK